MKNLDYRKARTLNDVEWFADFEIKQINENEKKGKISDFEAGWREALKVIKTIIRIENHEKEIDNDKRSAL